MSYRVLITASPMRQLWADMQELRAQFPADYVLADPVPDRSGSRLLSVLPSCDGWIAGAEPIGGEELGIGKEGRLRALVRWGVGMDNVDRNAAAELGVALDRTPGVFGDEVADLGIGYMLSLARQIVAIDRSVREGHWIRPAGISLRGKTAGVVGYGNIGQNLIEKLGAFGLRRIVYSQHKGQSLSNDGVLFCDWPQNLEAVDFLFLVSALTEGNRGMVSRQILQSLKPSAYLINLGRGALVDENELILALQKGQIAGAALDVFQEEPLPESSPLRTLKNVILGSHNASNTREGALRASEMAMRRVFNLLDKQ